SRDLIVRQTEFVGQALVRSRFVDGIEILALDIFDERQLEDLPIRVDWYVAHNDRHLEQARALRGAPSALARDDSIEIANPLHQNRLNDAVLLDGPCELVELCIIHPGARLLLVGREQIDVNFNRAMARRLRRVRNERAQSFSESRSSF